MKFDTNTRLLIVTAHPDDEVLGCGGTIAKAISHGAHVGILFLGEGISARFLAEEYGSEDFKKQTEQRQRESEAAIKILGIHEAKYGERLCTQFDTYPLLSLVKEIESFMEAFKPTILFTHNPSEVNIDHRIVHQAVETACRPTRPWIPKEIYTFEIICSNSFKFMSGFNPNVFVDISETWEKKLKAWNCYQGESRSFPFPRSDKGLEMLSHFRGIYVCMEKVEAFSLMRMIA